MKLNIGGKQFLTTKEILCQVEDTFLEVLVSGRHQTKLDDEGFMFIDRGQRYFPLILDWLSDISHISRALPLSDECFLAELEFYGLKEAVSEYIVVTGGTESDWKESDSVFVYNCLDKTWSNAPPLPIKVTGHGSVVIGDYMYLVGGISNGNDLKTAFKYSFSTKTWSSIADMISKRSNFGCCVVDGILFVVGGSDDDVMLKATEKYNPKTNVWQECVSMQLNRISHACVPSNGFVYAIGGQGNHYMPLKTVVRYDPKKNKWEDVAPMHFKITSPACAVNANGEIYANGEVYVGCTLHTCLEKYNPDTNQWSMLPSMKQPRVVCAGAYANNKMCVIGGTEKINDALASMEIYNPETQAWTEGTPLPESRRSLCTISVTGYHLRI